MASDINFRGEINEMSAGYFVREMETLAPRSAATIYLHTPGGDVYAGGEMINAFRAAATKRGCKFSLELGSLCASMGAAFLAAAKAEGCKVRAHANSEAMFHGCWSVAMGGADELTDQAKAMRDFNATVKADLARCGVTDTDEWFAADREKWLNANELKDLGLVDEIIEDAASDADLKTDAVKIAAKLNHKETPDMDETKVQEEETPAPVAEAPKFDAVRAEVVAEEQKKADARVAAVQSASDKKNAALMNENEAFKRENDSLKKDNLELTTKCDSLTSRHSEDEAAIKAKDAELSSLKAEVEKLNARHAEDEAKFKAVEAERDEARAQRDEARAQRDESERNRKAVAVAAMKPGPELPKFEDGLAACRTPAERSAFISSGNYRK